MSVYKTSLNKFKKIENISSIFSDHNGMTVEINHKNNTEKHTNTWKLSNVLLNNEQVNKKIKEEIKRYLETNENEDTNTQNLWNTGEGILRRKFVALQAYLKKQTNKSSNKQSNFKLKGT